LFAVELAFDGSVRVISGDNFMPSLGNNSSTAFTEMALKYQNMVSFYIEYFGSRQSFLMYETLSKVI
jgi:SEA domain.